ncbi:hypothetical protein Poly51_30700 [Rubripirellula tenax]|uniref:Uncharacterized protein n=1 Tax=Rubripirellula tenax TaxID=2528015 RepID=A0A5C6EXK5_9BACT|nr:hypothetical protein Poly51_30700 [Rubripirellula tenax]
MFQNIVCRTENAFGSAGLTIRVAGDEADEHNWGRLKDVAKIGSIKSTFFSLRQASRLLKQSVESIQGTCKVVEPS